MVAADSGPLNGDSYDSQRLDDVIKRIDSALPQIHKMCKSTKSQKPPTERLCREAAPRFRQLLRDPIVNADATEILAKKPPHLNGGEAKVNQASA